MLPKLKVPMFDVTIPSTGKDAKYRPYLVKEEKILLIAQSGGSKKEIINALKQVINNCIVLLDGSSVDVDSLTVLDLEYLFLKIRSKSVDNVVTLKYLDHEDNKTYEFQVDLDTIEIKHNPNHSTKIKVTNAVGIILKYPTAATVEKLSEANLTDQQSTDIMVRECIDKIYDEDGVYLAKESTVEELDEFINSMPIKSFEGIQEFFDSMPSLYHKIEYTNSKGTARVIELSTLDDFFTLG